MWKVNITVEDTQQICSYLNDYAKTLPTDSQDRHKALDLLAKLEGLLIEVMEEYRITEEYLEEIRKRNKCEISQKQ